MSEDFMPLGSARVHACWLRRSAATNFLGNAQSHAGAHISQLAHLEKFASAGRRRQHAWTRALPRQENSALVFGL
jgi:hypothetical protein